MNILITGGNGYLGSELIKQMYKKHTIVALEKNCPNPFRINQIPGITIWDIEKQPIDQLFAQHSFDVIIHVATLYGRNNEENFTLFEANTIAMLQLLEAAIKNNVQLFINTDTVLDRFTSTYALTKKQFADWLQFYAMNGKIQVINLELEHFYGPGSAATNFITLMTQKMLANEATIPLTKAEQNRDFLYITDLVNVYDLVIEKKDSFTQYEAFEVGAGINTNLKYLLETIKKETNSSSVLNFGAVPYRNNELMESKTNVSKLKNLGWTAKVAIEEGIKEVVKFERNFKC